MPCRRRSRSPISTSFRPIWSDRLIRHGCMTRGSASSTGTTSFAPPFTGATSTSRYKWCVRPRSFRGGSRIGVPVPLASRRVTGQRSWPMIRPLRSTSNAPRSCEWPSSGERTIGGRSAGVTTICSSMDGAFACSSGSCSRSTPIRHRCQPNRRSLGDMCAGCSSRIAARVNSSGAKRSPASPPRHRSRHAMRPIVAPRNGRTRCFCIT